MTETQRIDPGKCPYCGKSEPSRAKGKGIPMQMPPIYQCGGCSGLYVSGEPRWMTTSLFAGLAVIAAMLLGVTGFMWWGVHNGSIYFKQGPIVAIGAHAFTLYMVFVYGRKIQNRWLRVRNGQPFRNPPTFPCPLCSEPLERAEAKIGSNTCPHCNGSFTAT